jgi:hypothetical protein
MATITTSAVLSECAVIALSGATKIVAEDMVEGDEVFIYEETGTADNYQLVPISEQRSAALTHKFPSRIFEGYGNYKFLLGPNTDTGLVVAYFS